MAPAAVGSGGGNWIQEFCVLGETCHGGITPVGKKIQGSSGFGIRGTLGRHFLKELSSLEAEARREWIRRKKKKNPKIQLNDVFSSSFAHPGRENPSGRSEQRDGGRGTRKDGRDRPPRVCWEGFRPFLNSPPGIQRGWKGWRNVGRMETAWNGPKKNQGMEK